MPTVTRFACLLTLLTAAFFTSGCSNSGDTTPESEIPDIPPSTRTMPGQEGAAGGQQGDFMPAQPPR